MMYAAVDSMRKPAALDLQLERRLRVTLREETHIGGPARPRKAFKLFGRRVTTYYMCGACGIVVGCTPSLQMARGAVVRCHNCDTNNQL
jgi:hypothetical protein